MAAPATTGQAARAARIAAAQLAAAGRTRRTVRIGPLAGLLHPDPQWYLSYAVASRPGSPTDRDAVFDALPALRSEFDRAGRTLRFELVEEANPGMADALVEVGLSVTGWYPLLVCRAGALAVPDPPPGVVVRRVRTADQAGVAHAVSRRVFDMLPGAEPPPLTEPSEGGSVLAELHGAPVATAAWTAVADGVTEIVGVATLASHRGRGLGGLVTAHAVLAAADAGATLPWLTPGDEGADRVYRRIGFLPAATAVHLSAH